MNAAQSDKCWRKRPFLLAESAHANALNDPRYLGRRIRQGNDRFQGFSGISWKQYSHPEIFGFFPATSSRILTERAEKGQKSPEKSRHFLVEILLPSYGDFRQETLLFLTVTAGNAAFPDGYRRKRCLSCRFLREKHESGCQNHRPGYRRRILMRQGVGF